MRTYPTRLTMAAAAAMLTGVSLPGVAHAHDDDGIYHFDPSVLEDVENLEPCDEVSASDELLLPIDPNAIPDDFGAPAEPGETPLIPEGIDLVPCYQIPDGDDGDGEEGGNGNGGGNGGNGGGNGGQSGGGNGGGNGGQSGGGNGGGNGGQSGGGQPGGGSNGQSDQSSTGGPDGDDGEGSSETTDDQTQQPETTTPAAVSGGSGTGSLLLAITAGALGALGLFLLMYGLRKRPRRGLQPSR